MKEDINSILLLGEFDLILIFVVPILFTLYGVFVSRKANISTVELGRAFFWAYVPIAAIIIATLILALDSRPSDLAISLTSKNSVQLNCPNDVSPATEHGRILYNDDLKGCNFTVKFESRFSHYESILSWAIFCFFSLMTGVFICDVVKKIQDFLVEGVIGRLKNILTKD